MEDLTRLVADSLARHGFAVAVDHRRLEWSRWFRCESSFSLLLVPSAAGLYAVGEEIIAPGELTVASGKRMLAVFQVAETEDLCLALSRLFAPRNPLSERLSQGRCFVRFAIVADPHQRQAACESLNRWLSSSAYTVTSHAETTPLSSGPRPAEADEKCSGLPSGAPPDWNDDLIFAHDFVPPAEHVASLITRTEPRVGTPQSEPPPLPSGF